MCGIAGIYNLKRKTENEKREEVIKKMTDSIAHRGPDDEGFFIDENIALGHRRLSILDLSPAGHQPMFSPDSRYAIVFNGEIYNYKEIADELKVKGYKFKSNSDTEVILASYEEWGEKCLEKFNGMWAFCIYDSKENSIFCARDRLGVKPFYYWKNEETFVFASEIKAILEYPGMERVPNDQMVYDYLLHSFSDHTDQTFFKNIHQLLPGHFLKIQEARNKIQTEKEIEIHKYWDIPTRQAKISEEEAIKKLQEIFADSVNLRLRSDVAVGSCLSGGLDSSSIVVQVNELIKKDLETGEKRDLEKSIGEIQKTFSSVYKEKEFAKADEKEFIDEVIEKTKVKPYFTESDPSRLWKDLEKLTWHQDEPFGSTSIYAQYNVFGLAAENKVKVMLDGQGADEMLSGYLGTAGIYFAQLFSQGKWFRMMKECQDFRKIHPSVSNGAIFRNVIFALTQSFKGKFYNWIFRLSRKDALGVYNDKFVAKNFHAFSLPGKFSDVFKDFNYWLIKHTSLPLLLHWEDRNSMAHSIESRVPFLDYRLVEFVFSLPDDLIIKEGITKYILREAMKPLLPEKIYNRQDKVGFATPEEIWFKKYVRSDLEIIINSDSFKSRPYFNWPNVKKYFDEVMEGKRKFDFTIWRWISLEMWMRRFIDKR